MSRHWKVYAAVLDGTDQVKIGISRNVPARLLAVGASRKGKMIQLFAAPGTRELERAMHITFSCARTTGEWFESHDDNFIPAIRRVGGSVIFRRFALLLASLPLSSRRRVFRRFGTTERYFRCLAIWGQRDLEKYLCDEWDNVRQEKPTYVGSHRVWASERVIVSMSRREKLLFLKWSMNDEFNSLAEWIRWTLRRVVREKERKKQ